MKIYEIIGSLEQLANPKLQESYDNSGLIVGDKSLESTGVLISLDVTEDVVREAIEKNCNLIVAHHPILFRGIKSLTGANYVERTIIYAVKNDIAIYAIHTNLDNVIHGVNSKLAEKLNLINCHVLSEKESYLKKLVTFAPREQSEKVRNALFSSGAGAIGNYVECSFNLEGTGTFKATDGANPFVGEVGDRHSEIEERIEVIFPFYQEKQLIRNLRGAHPYEEVAFYITSLTNTEKNTGSGLIGELEQEVEETVFLQKLKEVLKTTVVKHTRLLNRKIKKAALCGGAGFFLLPDAKASGADIYITSDVKYHEFFDADGTILLADAGHYETEQYTIELLEEYLQNNFPNFAVQKTEHLTNPVLYFT